MTNRLSLAIFLVVTFSSASAAGPLTLEAAISRAYQSNAELSASSFRNEAEHSAIRAQYSLDNPRVGFMRENNIATMGSMDSWSVTQEIKFPVKYFLRGSVQRARSEATEQAFLDKKLDVRRKVIAAYFNLYASNRIIALLEAQKGTLREISRIAEVRYAAGSTGQQDEMKAHVEQARLEDEILMAKQEQDSMLAMLNTLLGRELSEEVNYPANDLPIPTVKAEVDSLVRTTKNSRRVKEGEFMLKESEANQRLASWAYAPDFMLSYRHALGYSSPNAYAFSIDVGIPLWFAIKETSENSAAAARLSEAEKTLQGAKLETLSMARTLFSKVKTGGTLLKIYDTSLIPLVTNTLSSSQRAYRAGRITFLELLDSERALYDTRISYYRTLAQYVEAITQLEHVLGTSISSLPMGGDL